MKLLILAAALLAQSDAPAPSDAAGTLLVGNKGEDSVSFIDLATGRELGRAATGRMPHEIAISPDGRQAAVVSYGAQSIDIFDIATRERLRVIDLAPNQGPHGIAWLPDGRIVATTERSQSLTVVDTRRGDAVTAISTGQRGTHMVAVAPDFRRAFTANIADGTVSVLDLASGTKLRDIAVGGSPEGIALTPDGRTLWVGDLRGARVQAFDAASFERVAEVATGPVPIRVLASPDGRWIVTSNLGCGCLTVIDAATRAAVRTVPVSGEEQARQVTILFSADGHRLYAAETGRNQIAEIDMASGTVLRRLAAGQDGDGLAIAPAHR
ncbi:cytochrome D1 domain-containing protein [Sphingosinicella sp. YJ22]|uniref:cytochrome D1 domain-containing protein n=1 Tax=Sphingosinicella sp. YJ22 TaxID=1104780 RepID=UPI00140A4A26|nr:cytochrome D1 domain-containing protein [Sphingosinicella sp. YJ22]